MAAVATVEGAAGLAVLAGDGRRAMVVVFRFVAAALAAPGRAGVRAVFVARFRPWPFLAAPVPRTGVAFVRVLFLPFRRAAFLADVRLATDPSFFVRGIAIK